MNKVSFQVPLMDVSGQYRSQKSQIDKAFRRVAFSGRYILGAEVEKFEEEFSAFCESTYCIGTSSGFASLYVALLALGVGSGDEVITAANTFTATAEAIALTGARVVFCDVEKGTFNMDIHSLKSKMSSKTKAVIPVHLHGNPCKMDEIMKLCRKNNIFIVEDAAQAQGAIYKNKIIGSLGSDLTCFSFHPVKNLGAMGDAGCIVTNNGKLAKRVSLLVNHGRVGHHKHTIIGTTNRLDSLQAAILSVKLRHLKNEIKKRRMLAAYYRNNLNKKVELMQTTSNCESAFHVFAILSSRRSALAKHLFNKNIETGMHYPIPLHLQGAYKNLGYKKGDFPNSEYYCKRTLSIPFYPTLSKEKAAFVVSKINDFFLQ